jgi:S1-C subfamily serine protease
MKKRIELSNSIRGRHHIVISLSIVLIILIVIIMFSFDTSTNSYNTKQVTTQQQQNEGNYGYAYTYFSSQQAATAVIQNDYQLKDVSLQNSSLSSSLPNIFKQVENSVVQITSKVSSNPGTQIIINGNPLGGQATRLGSGFVYDKQGHIISNSHVVNGAKTVDVTFVDGNTYTANIIGNDPSSDIAVLQITDNTYSSAEKNGIPLVIANSSSLQVGEQIIAIGNPFGLSDTMTTGIVSQIGRLIPNPDTGFSIPDGIQTDAAINPGNSGGPLLNMQGQVVGVNSAIISGTGTFSGLGFAIPSNSITRIVPILIEKGSYDHPWLGITGSKITPDIAQSNGIPRNMKGVVVASALAGSPADKAGLKAMSQDMLNSRTQIGDIITAIDGQPVKQIDDIITHIELTKSVGDTVKLTVNRSGKTIELDVVLQARPNSLLQPQQQASQQQPDQPSSPTPTPPPSSDSSNNLLGNLYNSCIGILGKEICNTLFGK